MAVQQMARRYQDAPVLTGKEREKMNGGKIIPPVRRATRPHQQNNNIPLPKGNGILVVEDDDERSTEDLDYGNDPRTENVSIVPYTARRPRQSSHQQAQYQKQAQHSVIPSWLFPVGVGAVGLIVLYSALFFIVVGYTAVYNNVNYSPVHTSNMDTTIGQQHEHIIAVNVHGTVFVTLIQRDATGKITTLTYAESAQNKASWNNDLNAIVPTIEVKTLNTKTVIRIHLIGGFDYTHAFMRPTHTFDLLSTGTGYTLVDESDQ